MSTLSAWNSRITLGSIEPTIFGPVGPFSPQIMQLKNGEVLVSWRNISIAGDVVSLVQKGQIFSTVGANIVPAFTVTDQAGAAIFSEQGTDLRLSEKQDGGVIGIFKDGDAIKLQEFTAAGAPSVTNQIVVTPVAGSGDIFGPVDVASTSRLSSLVAYGELRSTGSVTTRSTDMFDLFGKIYNPLINAYGSERTLINGPVENFSTHALANGNYLVVAGQATIEVSFFGPLPTFNRDESIVFSLFTSNGSLVKNTETIALSNDFNESPEVFNDYIATGLDNSGFVVAYQVRSGETTGSFTFANLFQIYDAAGASSHIGSVPSGEMLAVTTLPNAEFVILYRDGVELRAQHLSDTGARLANFLLDTVQTTLGQGDVEIVGLQDGRFAATWKTTSDLVAFQIFDTRETFDGALVHPLTFEQLGTVFDDVFTVGAKTTLARGFAGDDTITQLSGTSSVGPASITGDDGDDTVVMKNPFNTDTIDGGAGIDTIDWRASGELGGVFSLASGTAVGAGGFTQVMTGFENLIGTSSPDVINGTSVANVLSGFGGDDIINGGNGADTINGGADNDHLFGGTGADVINGGTGKDTIDGEIGDDTADYSGSSVGLTVDFLTPSSNTGEAAGDTYVSIENLRGSGLNDTLRGDGGNNIINGGAGTDGMSGRGGDDTYIVENIGDRVYETTTPTSGIDSGGLDTVFSSVTMSLDAYSAVRFVENLTLSGAASINGFGNALANVMIGNSGNNSLDGGLGNDTMIGGAGNDIYVVDSISDQVFETTKISGAIDAGGIDTIQSSVTLSLDASAGVRFVERLTLTGAANINATGNALANVLIGNSGNNTLNGGLGIDIMGGGAGNDIYVVDNAGDRVFETTLINTLIDAGGVDTMQSSVSTSIDAYAAVRFIENLTLTGTDNLVGVGNAKDNVLLGNSGNNTLNGGLGSDTMGGGAGNDIYIVDSIGDRVFEMTTISSGIDAGGVDIIQSSVALSLDAYAGVRFVERLTLTGTGNINGLGNALDNVMLGNSGNNALNGGLGADIMGGGAGNDIYVVDSVNDRVFETITISSLIDAGGLDTIQTSVTTNLDAYAAVRFVENLTLTGTANIDGAGNALANVLTGNSGNNTLNGGLGNDTMFGGLGADTFVFSTTLGASNIDQITGFSVVDDTIRLDDAVFLGLAPNTLAANAFAANLTGEAATDFDRIIYETDTGGLFYDNDGLGGAARVQFATLTTGLALTNADFFVF